MEVIRTSDPQQASPDGAALFWDALAPEGGKDKAKTELPCQGKELLFTATEDPDWLCPITQDLMRDPVIAADGTCYEREAIETWFAHHDTSPLTNLPIANKHLKPNDALRCAMQKEAESNEEVRIALEANGQKFCRFCERAYAHGQEQEHEGCKSDRRAKLKADRHQELAEIIQDAPMAAGATATAAGIGATVGVLASGVAEGVSNFATGTAEVVGAVGDHVRRFRGADVAPRMLQNTMGEGVHQRSVAGGLTRATVGTIIRPMGGAVTAAGCAVGTVAAAGFTIGAGLFTGGRAVRRRARQIAAARAARRGWGPRGNEEEDDDNEDGNGSAHSQDEIEEREEALDEALDSSFTLDEGDDDTGLPYGGDVQAAQRAGDRAAIRRIMTARIPHRAAAALQ
jgi:hypothetical protein